MFEVGFDLFSTLFPIFFTIIFVFIIGTMIAMIVRGAKETRKNDASPRLSVPATVVTKRTNVSHRHHNGATMGCSSRATAERCISRARATSASTGADVFCAPILFFLFFEKEKNRRAR